MRKIITSSSGTKVVTHNGKAFYTQDRMPPEGYTLLQYVTLKNELIDTGEKTTRETQIDAKIHVTSATSVATYLWYSDSNSSGTTNTTAYCSSSGNWRFNGKSFSIANANYVGAAHVFKQNKSGVWIDGTSKGTYSSPSTFTSSANLRFGSSSANGQMNVYYFKHTKDGVVVSDYIPVKNASNVAGFYDLAKEEFIAGGTAGPAVE